MFFSIVYRQGSASRYAEMSDLSYRNQGEYDVNQSRRNLRGEAQKMLSSPPYGRIRGSDEARWTSI